MTTLNSLHTSHVLSIAFYTSDIPDECHALYAKDLGVHFK